MRWDEKNYGFRPCGVCGLMFEKTSAGRKYCSDECMAEAKKRREARTVTVVCEDCGAEYERTVKESKRRGDRRTLCVACRGRGFRNHGLRRASDGRMVITCRDGSRVYFYRALMEAAIGRHLTTDEVVHHRNGDPTDDRLENLEVMSKSDHTALHTEDLWERGVYDATPKAQVAALKEHESESRYGGYSS